MKNQLVLFLTLALMLIASCEKVVNEAPGNISGLGNNKEEIQIQKTFELPQGIKILGEISGVGSPGSGNGKLKKSYVYDSYTPHFGSGQVVKLKLTLLNPGNTRRTVFFPKGLIWKCISGIYQHGLQCQTVWVCLEPNEQRTVYIDLYCANLGIPAPDENGKYIILGITSSKVLWNLLNIIGWRKINYEMIMGSYLGSVGKGTPSYEEITEKLQIMVHNLTNRGIELTEDDKAFISSIPELAPEDRPVLDENAQYPEYFEEFKPPVK